jgi:EAL domain-containing protein (putative c-di-GMP-specific phosphodiesterase class I)
VAEGVETGAHLDRLRSLGCRLGQGYLFSMPIDAESVEDFLAAGGNIFERQLDLRSMTAVVELADVQ